MTGEFMRNAKVAGYQKFTDMAANFNALLMRAKELPDDVVVYFFGHSERDGDGGEKFKTIGKLLDEKVCVEGYFTIVLKTVVQDGRYLFSTRNDGIITLTSIIDRKYSAKTASARSMAKQEQRASRC